MRKVTLGTQLPKESCSAEFPMNPGVRISQDDTHTALPQNLNHFLKSLQTGQIHERHAKQSDDQNVGHTVRTDERSLHSLSGSKEEGALNRVHENAWGQSGHPLMRVLEAQLLRAVLFDFNARGHAAPILTATTRSANTVSRQVTRRMATSARGACRMTRKKCWAPLIFHATTNSIAAKAASGTFAACGERISTTRTSVKAWTTPA